MEWNAENVAALDNKKLESLRANALRKNNLPVVEMCEAELALRKKPKVKRASKPLSGDVGAVIGFHFVCDNEKGVTRNPDGTLWTGTWVVAKLQAEKALITGTYVALHRVKSEQSYIQGTIIRWREAPRERRYGDADVKTKMGIDFLVEPTVKPFEWVGDGTGEKGYARESSVLEPHASN